MPIWFQNFKKLHLLVYFPLRRAGVCDTTDNQDLKMEEIREVYLICNHKTCKKRTTKWITSQLYKSFLCF